MCKAPTPRLKSLNKHNTYNVHRDDFFKIHNSTFKAWNGGGVGGGGGGGGLAEGSDLGKGRSSQFQTSQGMNGKTRVPGAKKSLVGRRESPIDINLHEGFTAIKAQENKTLKKKDKKERGGGERKRESYICAHTRTYTHAYTHYYSSVVGCSELGIGRREWGDN